jgi:hypothetical protein
MRPWNFLSAKPSEGWKFATSAFYFSWMITTISPLFIVRRPGEPLESWQLCWLLANWAIASTFVLATFTNVIRLSDRVRQLEEAGATGHQPS